MSGASEEDDVLLASPSASEGPSRAEPRDGAAFASPRAGTPLTPSRYPARVTPADVLALTAPTETFLCPLSANVYDFDFLDFEIKDYDTGESVFKITKNPELSLPDDKFKDANEPELGSRGADGAVHVPGKSVALRRHPNRADVFGGRRAGA